MRKYQQDFDLRPRRRNHTRTILRVVFLGVTIWALFWLYGFVGAMLQTDPDPEVAYEKPSLVRGLKRLVFSGNRLLDGFNDDRINVLFMGVGGAGHDGPQLSDTIILASYRPSTEQVALLSLPRDMAVTIPGYGVRKINHANAYGEQEFPGDGGSFASKVIESVLDEPIHYYTRVDFTAFEDIVDTLGGLSIDIEQTFIDETYPTDDFGVQTIVFESGTELMDGQRALQYARSRHGSHGEGSDFARAQRQQKILSALRAKILTPSTLANPTKITGLFNTLKTHVDTNLNLLEILEFVKKAKNVDTDEIVNHVLTIGPDSLLQEINNDYGYFLTPKAGDYSEVAHFVDNMFDTQPPPPPARFTVDVSAFRSARITILNGTWEPGLAGALRQQLQSEGINVKHIGNTPERGYEQTVIYQITQDEKADAAMSRIIPFVPGEISLNELDFILDNPADIVIIIGSDSPLSQSQQ